MIQRSSTGREPMNLQLLKCDGCGELALLHWAVWCERCKECTHIFCTNNCYADWCERKEAEYAWGMGDHYEEEKLNQGGNFD